MNRNERTPERRRTPHLWIRRPKLIEPREPLRMPQRGLTGRFKLIGRKRDGRSRVLADWFPNLITNAGLDHLGDPNSHWFQECRVGSGTNAPANGDTALQTQVATTTTTQDTNEGATAEMPFYGFFQKTFRFAEGVAAGNLSEVGIGPTGGDLFNRARILDGEGNPTTTTVLADEILDVVYELRNYAPEDDLVYSEFDFGGSDLIRVVTIRPAQVNSASVWSMFVENGHSRCTAGVRVDDLSASAVARAASTAIVSTTTAISDTIGEAASDGSVIAYVGGNHYVDAELIWGLNTANFGGGGVLSLHFRVGDNGSSSTGLRDRFGRYQVGFDTGLPKDNTKILAFTFRNTWARKAL